MVLWMNIKMHIILFITAQSYVLYLYSIAFSITALNAVSLGCIRDKKIWQHNQCMSLINSSLFCDSNLSITTSGHKSGDLILLCQSVFVHKPIKIGLASINCMDIFFFFVSFNYCGKHVGGMEVFYEKGC